MGDCCSFHVLSISVCANKNYAQRSLFYLTFLWYAQDMVKRNASPGDPLTNREGEVWAALAQDATVEEIRSLLGVSGPTFSAHVNALKVKLGCRTITGLVLRLLDSKLGELNVS
jgi:DNA-binding CsgD family transcriptional regulator